MSDTITLVADAMQTVLEQVPQAQAKATGFIKRQRKLTATVFVKALVFGWLANPKASLDELARVATLLGVPIQPQSLEERFTPEAAELLRRVLEASILAVISADPVAIAILDRFTEVVVMDSSTVSLPEPLRGLFAGLWHLQSPGRQCRGQVDRRLGPEGRRAAGAAAGCGAAQRQEDGAGPGGPAGRVVAGGRPGLFSTGAPGRHRSRRGLLLEPVPAPDGGLR